MFSSLFASALLAFSISGKSVRPVTVPCTINPIVQKHEFRSQYRILGSYNLRDTYDSDIFTEIDGGNYSIVFSDPDVYNYNCLFYFSGNYGNIQTLNSIDIYVDYDEYIQFRFNWSSVYTRGNFDIVFTDGIEIEDISTDVSDLIFNSINQVVLSGNTAKLFDAFFTTEDNVYTTTYSGYYNFSNDLQRINQTFYGFGSIVFDNSLNLGFTNANDGVLGSPTQFYLWYQDYNEQDHLYFITARIYGLPLDNDTIYSPNILMTGVKMPITSKQTLSNVGVFAYVRDTSFDNATFKDLLFSVMDSPIYMLSRLLSFELFGVSLFVALTGLLTICVILVLIRKFW